MKEGKIEKEYNIVGKGLTPEEKKETSYYLEGRKDGAMEPIEGEYLKTPEELKAIEHINKYLNEEFKELGIKEKVNIKPEQIHLLPADVYNRLPGASAEYKLRAFFHGPNQGIYIDKYDSKTRLELYKTIFHEAVHMASFLKFGMKKEEKRPFLYRSGYDVTVEGAKKHEHFCGLNEMVVDQVVSDMLIKHEKELIKKFKITPEEEKESIYYYPSYVLDVILKKIAQNNNEDIKNTWKRFKKGLFTGEMMHLRKVERTFGKGSLRMLAALESGTKEECDKETYGEILKFFKSDNQEEKDKIAEKILVEREKEEYRKQKK